ncbi:MAG: YggS family pyridoxal phosphate-dependent enzyme [Pyrinomonadaceae bacterium]
MDADIRTNLETVQKRIAAAAARANRDRSEIRLVAVSKTHPATLVRQAIDAGASVFGENKVQEAESKILDVGRDAAEWHLIGHLQSNKARKAVQLFDVIQSVDSLDLAQRLERICEEEGRDKLSVFVQVDLGRETTKTGIAEGGLAKLAGFLTTCKCLKFNGLMIVPPFFEEGEKTRAYFARLREIRDSLVEQKAFANGRGELSMGMSHDFEVAIEEGSTVVRVGTAIFGERGKNVATDKGG